MSLASVHIVSRNSINPALLLCFSKAWLDFLYFCFNFLGERPFPQRPNGYRMIVLLIDFVSYLTRLLLLVLN